nr:hypothetical protein [Actinomadura montaniterrae]
MVDLLKLVRSAIKALDRWVAPGSAHPSTIRHRNAYVCVEVAARAPRSNSARSAAVTENGAFGRPVLVITPA